MTQNDIAAPTGAADPLAPVGPLLHMTRTTRTALWNDSADPLELTESLTFGTVGATCNPVIALACIKADLPTWRARIAELAAEHPTATEDAIGWLVVEELSVSAARLLEPVFREHNGRNGRLSIQTDPRFHRDAASLVEQAAHFASLAENIIVKIPATAAGIVAMEEATYRGISINATVSFTVPQALAVGAAVERGLKRREAEGLDVSTMGPVCTIMGGRTRRLAEADGRARQGDHRPRPFRVGRRRGAQEGLRHLPGAWLPHPGAVGSLPQPHAVERVDRW